jgi:hypothetical protein
MQGLRLRMRSIRMRHSSSTVLCPARAGARRGRPCAALRALWPARRAGRETLTAAFLRVVRMFLRLLSC